MEYKKMNSKPDSETINLFSDNTDNNIINNFEVIRVEKRKKTVSFSHSVDIVNVENQKQLTRRMSTPHNIIEENLKKVEFAKTLDDTIFEDEQKCFLCQIF